VQPGAVDFFLINAQHPVTVVFQELDNKVERK
jgi:hypothetical protein